MSQFVNSAGDAGYAILKTDAIMPGKSGRIQIPYLIELLENSSKSKALGIAVKQNIVNYWGHRGITILGDAISVGAYAGSCHMNSWVGIFRKFANIEHGSTNYGFVGLHDRTTTPAGSYTEEHRLAQTGLWADLVDADEPTGLISGHAKASRTVGATITITVPTNYSHFRIWYKKDIHGGEFTIQVNSSVDIITIDTGVTLADEVTTGSFTPVYDSVDGGGGSFTVKITATSDKSVSILGMSYFDDAGGSEFCVDNFSTPGSSSPSRCLSDVSVNVINDVCRGGGGNGLIIALGAYDALYDTPARQQDFAAKIDALISAATANKTKVIMMDFCWGKDKTYFTRKGMRRAADQIPGAEYIAFPEYFSPDGAIISVEDLKTTYSILADNIHPTVLGHRLIAETLAKTLNFSVTSKKVAEICEPRWTATLLLNGWSNSQLNSLSCCAFRIVGSTLQVRYSLNPASKTSDQCIYIPSGSPLCEIPVECTFPQYDVASGLLYYIVVPSGASSVLSLLNPNHIVAAAFSGLIEIPLNLQNNFYRYR